MAGAGEERELAMKLAGLVFRSDYSFYCPLAGERSVVGEVRRSAGVRGAVSARRWVAAAKAGGYHTVGMADVNSMAGAVEFWQAAAEAGLRAVVGVEVLTASERVVLLARDRQGYRNMCRVVTARNLRDDFDVYEELGRGSGGLSCVGFRREVLGRLREAAGDERVWAGCRDAGEALAALAGGYRPVAWGEFHVIDERDELRARLLGRIGALGQDGGGGAVRPELGRLVSEEEFRGRFKLGGCEEALRNQRELVQGCRLELPPGREYLPEVRVKDGLDADTQLARLCHVGMMRRYGTLEEGKLRRLEHELAVIRRNRFSGYFLLVREIVDFARGRGIPVDVRGSAAGALVSHVLGFTRVCPVENQLYFERFMNAGRKDCPDVDIDLCWRRRDEVIDFCYERWGASRVAMIATVNRYRRRSAIRDAARALGIPPSQIGELVSRPERHEGAAVYRLADELLEVPRHLGLHCGGIVITPRAVGELAPLERATKGVVVTQYDKDAAEAMGLVKIDLLGNRSLSTVAESVAVLASGAARQSGTRVDDGWVDKLPAGDEKTAAMLSRGESLGVFQCESPGMRQLLRGLGVRDRRDLSIALSLIRPGPASGGMKEQYIARHVRGEPFTYLHPKLAEVLGDTHGVMLYQEDVMRVAVELAGYSVDEADQFRSEVSKKVSGVRVERQYKDFVYNRAVAAGIDRGAAEALWDEILRFAAYSYCKAHATVYGYIAWQTAWLKAHHPQAFYTALLNNHQGMYPLRVYVWDAIRHGVKAWGPHVNESTVEWEAQGRGIRAGLNLVRGLTGGTMEAVVRERLRGRFADLADLRRRVRFRRGELEALVHVGACDGLGAARPMMLAELRQPVEEGRGGWLFDVYGQESVAALGDYDRIARMNAEVAVTGVPFSLHPALLIRQRFVPARRLGAYVGREVRVAGYPAAARTAQARDGRAMGFLTLDDYSGLAEVTFFPDQMGVYRQALRLSGPVWVEGKVTEHLSSVGLEGRACGGLDALAAGRAGGGGSRPEPVGASGRAENAYGFAV